MGKYEEAGFEEWHSIQHIIILDQNIRQKDYLRYSRLLKRLREGHCNEYDLKTINSRHFSESK